MSLSPPIPSNPGLMFRLEVALLMTIVAAGVWMGLAGCTSDVSHASPAEPVTGQFGTEAAFQHLVHRTSQMDAEPLQAATGPRVSDLFPDVVLTNHRNETLRFRSDLVRDRIVCIAMFYTRCTGTCPGTISKVLALRKSLSSEFDPDNMNFICITLDPEHDDVGQLQQFANQLHVNDSPDLGHIHFCTGSHHDIEILRRALGMYDLDPEIDADKSQHAAMLVSGNDRFNRWAASPAGLKLTDLHETALRIAGVSERQRFAARFATDSGFSFTALRELDAEQHACCKPARTADAAAACCSQAPQTPQNGDASAEE